MTDEHPAKEGEDRKFFYRSAGCAVLLAIVLVGVSLLQYPLFPLPTFWLERQAEVTSAEQTEEYIRLNTATAEELESLPGIGPVTAKAILEYREAHGGFQSLEELQEVKGIGPKTLEALLPYLIL